MTTATRTWKCSDEEVFEAALSALDEVRRRRDEIRDARADNPAPDKLERLERRNARLEDFEEEARVNLMAVRAAELDEVLAATRKSMEVLRTAERALAGRATLAINVVTRMTDGKTGQPIKHNVPDQTLYRHLELPITDGAVISMTLPREVVVQREVQADPTRVVMPAGWAKELAAALKELPPASVTVDVSPTPVSIENVVQIPEDGPREVKFDRDYQGRITGATIEDAA
jgi:hypothetical protein